jgi:hypothetical protein
MELADIESDPEGAFGLGTEPLDQPAPSGQTAEKAGYRAGVLAAAVCVQADG